MNKEPNLDLVDIERYLAPDQPLQYLVCQDEMLHDLLPHAAAVYPNSNQFVTITGYHGRGKSTILEALTDRVSHDIESVECSPLIFHYSCEPDEKPKYIYQQLLTEFDIECYVKNKDVISVWRRVKQELEQSEYDALLLFLDDVDNLCRRKKFIQTIVRYTGNAGLGVFVTATTPRWDQGLPADLRSRYRPVRYDVTEWIDWTPAMITDVLRDRAEDFLPDTVSESVLNYIATNHSNDEFYGFTGALAILYWAALHAKQDCIPISQEHVDYGVERLNDCRVIRRLRSKEFDIHDQTLLASLAAADRDDSLPVRTTELYDRYQKALAEEDIQSISEDRFRDRITSWEMKGPLETNLIKKGADNGRSYEIALQCNPDAVLTAIAIEGESEFSTNTSFVPGPFLKLTEPLN